ncbi:hypothetical protein FJZ31_18065 [Candidatus Poribacteria bacterium]|nr:hypothetical protein [Candidatus Poribacteria bacterium]
MQSKAFLFALVASIFWGLAPIFGKLGLVKVEPTVALTLRSFVISFVLLVWVITTGNLNDLYSLVTSKSGIFIAAEGIFASLLGHLAYYYAVKYGDVSKMTPVVSSFPLITVILAILFLGEKFTFTKLIGAILIIAGVLFIKK